MKTSVIIFISFAFAAWASLVAANGNKTSPIHIHDESNIRRNGSNYEVNMFHRWQLNGQILVAALQRECQKFSVSGCQSQIDLIRTDIDNFILSAVKLLAFYDHVDVNNITRHDTYNITQNDKPKNKVVQIAL